MTTTGDAPADPRRRASYHAGYAAERWAALLLILKGYRVLARRYAVRGGEIDIVARRGDLVVFVEVKARPITDAAIAAITAQKQRRIARAASVWLARNPWAHRCSLRGDAVVLAPRRWPRHIPDAFPLRIG